MYIFYLFHGECVRQSAEVCHLPTCFSVQTKKNAEYVPEKHKKSSYIVLEAIA
jgi:hypothetical protein